jgi:hypothetical protein
MTNKNVRISFRILIVITTQILFETKAIFQTKARASMKFLLTRKPVYYTKNFDRTKKMFAQTSRLHFEPKCLATAAKIISTNQILAIVTNFNKRDIQRTKFLRERVKESERERGEREYECV